MRGTVGTGDKEKDWAALGNRLHRLFARGSGHCGKLSV